ncbi:MAG: aldose 1-epimerase [Clostridia bacterium]|nr:aldose 1-epimerase [Clostridia bacterium]
MIKTDVKISGGGYVAEFRSDFGGNCYKLCHTESGAELLRTPKDDNELLSEIYLFGNPILFPPNRISGASFTFEGREYKFPMNEKATGCHIHGALYKTPFEIKELYSDSVVFYYRAKAGEYIGFPHDFRIERSYKADENGLTECVEVFNESEENMPFMLAFHTTMNVPFIPSSSGEDCYFYAPVGREHIRDDKYLPTLEYVGGRKREKELSSGEYKVYEGPLSAFYESLGNENRIIDKASGRELYYRASEEYKYRMLWRKDGAPYLVAEPQTAAIDCFHLEEPADKKGLIVIAPGKSRKLYTYFGIK